MLPTSNKLTRVVNDRNTAMNWLLEQFPLAFNLGNRKPLQVDILSDIIDSQRPNTPTQAALEAALSYYMDWGSYLAALKTGAKRINLLGEPVGDVTQADEDEAQAILNAAKQKCS